MVVQVTNGIKFQLMFWRVYCYTGCDIGYCVYIGGHRPVHVSCVNVYHFCVISCATFCDVFYMLDCQCYQFCVLSLNVTVVTFFLTGLLDLSFMSLC